MMLLQDVRQGSPEDTHREDQWVGLQSPLSRGDAVLVQGLSHFRIGLIESLSSVVTS